jgi:hypothetical protein
MTEIRSIALTHVDDVFIKSMTDSRELQEEIDGSLHYSTLFPGNPKHRSVPLYRLGKKAS